MFDQLAHLHYPTHNSLVYTNTQSGRIYCVKYNQQYMEWDYWEKDQEDLVKEYMIGPLPDGTWGFSGESE